MLCNSSEKAQERLYYLPEHKKLNRYTDILTYDHTRVKFDSNQDTDYINACFINVSDLNSFKFLKSPLGQDRKIIATQGPKP